MFERNRDAHKPGTGRLRTVLAVAAVTAVVASMAIVGTVAAQPGQRFLDVPRTHYAYDEIDWAVANGITRGCTVDGRHFCPEQTLTRAHTVAFLKRYHDKFHGGAAIGTGTTTTTTTVPQDHVLSGIGSGDYDSVTLSEGRYRVSIAVALNYTFPQTGTLDPEVITAATFHPIETVTVMVGGQNTATDRVILTLEPVTVAVAADTRPTITRWTARGNTNLIVRRGLLEISPGRVDFTVALDAANNPLDSRKTSTVSVAAAVWEITVSGG